MRNRIVGICLILGGVGYLLSVAFGYGRAEAVYTEVAEKVLETEKDSTGYTEGEEEIAGTESTNGEESGAEIRYAESSDGAVCDALAGIMKENPNVMGFLVFEDEGVAYPVMQGEDNIYYLEHMWSGEKNRAGSIFADTLNHRDWQDSHTILYGHNMKNGSMFGFLKKYREREYYAEHAVFTVYTAAGADKYLIFSCYDVSETSEIYTIWYTPDSGFEKLVSKMQQNSCYNTGVEVTGEDKILTLSTCSASGKRLVVHAKCIE